MASRDQLFNTIPIPSCPATGLPITIKPEWEDISLDSDYSVTFSIIGKAILLVTPKGYPSEEGAKALLEKREEVLIATGLSDKKYAEIRDYRLLSGKPSKGARMVLTNFLLKEGSAGHLQGYWVFGASLIIRYMLRAGLRMHKTFIPIDAVKDYTEAVGNALNVLRQNGVDAGSKLYTRIKKDGWELELDGYGISFELIGDDILYTIAHGDLKESYIEQFINLYENVLEEAGLNQKGYYRRIVNWERFDSSSWKARHMYLDGLKKLNKKTPCKLSVIFGLNKFMKALVLINRPFVSIPVFVANDLLEALSRHGLVEVRLTAAVLARRQCPVAVGLVQLLRAAALVRTQFARVSDEVGQPVLGPAVGLGRVLQRGALGQVPARGEELLRAFDEPGQHPPARLLEQH